MFKGFKNFVMRGDIVVVAVGLIIALALSTLIKAFTDSVINPIIASAQGGHSFGLGWQLGRAGNKATYLDLGSFISAAVYFVIFMAVVYFLIVVPYRHVQTRRGVTVFAEPLPVRTCPACLAEDVPTAATRCRYCCADLPPVGTMPPHH
ncbi:MscL family protein [Streptomyces sp. AV19]|uniref:large conductance mechanosensitive channel protein MscL n=1 Tax=Streptomyces sp. AV19 TaxID=2793068 RepID=UPI0018FE9A70|nr:MscL family protein [Streptomyces sp. AV19]MBH1937879.1 MscL family protein [Streptomyces sp. AV19]MDG4536522.1 MscL family protein [Streptomyces sp. AV19]